MSVTPELVKKLAYLARLEIKDDELAAMTRDMEQLVALADRLAALDLSQTPPMDHVLPRANVLRDDAEPVEFPREQALSGAPEAVDGCFTVPRVVE
ncbi:MAG: Asp-tRNA(Asn)/Glu-tRNA(Gln) amidotransferase subunit GatC [Christensenellales bacterium]|jgi:aspartyl-tRNA(Asn)/glutamyl-tRNA(Gln) amidotransferase subunit C